MVLKMNSGKAKPQTFASTQWASITGWTGGHVPHFLKFCIL